MVETKEKILDTAEQLFGEKGYAPTSLRQVIAAAEVNLAAVHYHFGSKEELLDALIHRKADGVNQERLARLERLEAQAGNRPIPVRALLEGFLMPMVGVAESHPQFVRLIGRVQAEGLLPGIVQKHFQPIAKRYIAALRRSIPNLPEPEFLWRVHFMVGAMAHTMGGTPIFPGPPEAFHGRMRKLVTFLTAGFLAPAGKPEEK